MIVGVGKRGPIGLFAVGIVLASCARAALDPSDQKVSALTGTITISGSITDANGLPLTGVKVNLDGTSQAVQITAGGGTYSFGGLVAGSYSVRPTLNNCGFVPDVVNLNNLKASQAQNFAGAGAGCGGTASVNSGATAGQFTISGHIRNTSNQPVVGVQISLNGNAQALRFSDISGGYTFHVNQGTYSLAVSGACVLTPTNVNINNLTANRVQDFSATTATCMTSKVSNTTPTGAVFTISQGSSTLGATLASVEARASNADALARLQQIATELNGQTRSITIAGLPAFERQVLVEKESERAIVPEGPLLWLTTAIAAGNTLVRFESQLPANASAATINTFFVTARNFTTDGTTALHGPARAIIPAASPVPPATPPPLPSPLFAASMANTFGEIAMAASDSSNAVIYARNPGVQTGSRLTFSTDGGQTIQTSTITLNATSAGTFSFRGDPIAAVGAPNSAGAQAFYFGELYQTSTSSTLGPLFAIVTFQSTDNGKTFTQPSGTSPNGGVPLDCTVSGTCTVPDQPMLTGDKRTQSSLGDRLYVSWRHFGTPGGTGVSCSSNGGSTWTTPDITSISTTGSDFPRLSVAPDGSVYVIYGSGGTVWVLKFSSCDNGFTPQTAAGFPVKIQTGVGALPEMPGLDRAPSGGAYMIAPDDSDATGQRLFAIYADEVSSSGALGNDNIRVAESTNGGVNWTVAPTPVNQVSNGHRFLPWICSTNGIGYVTWYDRRDSTVGNADPTGYFRASIGDPLNTGTPVFGAEVNVSGGPAFDDQQCTSGFYPNLGGAARSASEETLCTDLPALPAAVNAGSCTSTCPSGSSPPCGSQAPCDFRNGTSACSTAGETCTTGIGMPKYGDYNGSGCANGQLFMAWASTTTPQGFNCAVAGGACTTSANCCRGSTCVASVCSPSGFSCAGNGSACTTQGACCSGNCFGGVCQAGVNLFTSSTAVTTNATCTTAVPDLSANAPFEVDTGMPPSTVGSSYGSTACPGQFLVDVDLTQAGFAGKDFFVSGRWSLSLPATPCDEQATMTVFVSPDGTNWQTFDVVQYVADLEGTICHAQAQSHTNAGSVNLGGTNVPASSNFQRVRVAISASETGTPVPVLVIGEMN